MAVSDSLLHAPLAFVDIETTGGSYRYARVLEIGVIRVEHGRVVREMKQLINPGSAVPSEITRLTGITTHDVVDAPSFAEVAAELVKILDGAIFVAHNVHFDYNFIKMEFDRLGYHFNPKLLCTVRLSRRLYAGQRGHSLQAIIDRFGLATAARHRAYDDARVLWDFWQLILGEFDLDTVELAIKAQIKTPSLPSHLDKALIDNLPTGPGVYIFEDEHGVPLYIGKSVSIRKRVLSHFTDFHSSSTELKISTKIHHVRTIPSHGELGALLTESSLIKELQPLYNKQLRRSTRVTLAMRHRDPAGYQRLAFHDADMIDPTQAGLIMAVYPTAGRARQSLHTMARNFYLCPKLMGLEKANGACFQVQLRKCHGACEGLEDASDYNARFEAAFERTRLEAWPYAGPILVTERHPRLEGSEGIIIDRWCLAGRLREYEDGGVEYTKQAGDFSLDAYKIIRSYLQDPRRRSHIRPLSTETLTSLTR